MHLIVSHTFFWCCFLKHSTLQFVRAPVNSPLLSSASDSCQPNKYSLCTQRSIPLPSCSKIDPLSPPLLFSSHCQTRSFRTHVNRWSSEAPTDGQSCPDSVTLLPNEYQLRAPRKSGKNRVRGEQKRDRESDSFPHVCGRIRENRDVLICMRERVTVWERERETTREGSGRYWIVD